MEQITRASNIVAVERAAAHKPLPYFFNPTLAHKLSHSLLNERFHTFQLNHHGPRDGPKKQVRD